MDRGIKLLLTNIKLRMDERRMIQRMKELRFPSRKPNPLFAPLSSSMSLYVWGKVQDQINIIKKLKTPYEYLLDKVIVD